MWIRKLRLTGLLVGIALCKIVSAEPLPTLSLRYMAIEADVILVGEPVKSDGKDLPGKFTVTDVLKGRSALAGQQVSVWYGSIYTLKPRRMRGEKSTPPPEIEKALLFLHYATKEGATGDYRPVLSGIRALTTDGQILVPTQLISPGPLHLIPVTDITWDAMLKRVRDDLPQIARIRELEKIPDQAKRNQAVLSWIEEHRDEFEGGYFDEESNGWASLQQPLFEWVMESCIPDDCWRAIELSAEVGSGPNQEYPSFCSPRGREILLTKISDPDVSQYLHHKAWEELGSGATYWYGHGHPTTSTITEEQEAIIHRVLPYLKHEKSSWRESAVRCLTAVSWPYDANYSEMKSTLAIPNLVRLHHDERDNEVRKAVAIAIRRIESEAFWRRLTGNPEGILVTIGFDGRERDLLRFSLLLEHTRAKITEPPVFRFDRLEADGSIADGSAEETRLIKPAVSSPIDIFTQGWESWRGMVSMTTPATETPLGLWRVTVEGRLGEQPWRSEPIDVSIPESKNERDD